MSHFPFEALLIRILRGLDSSHERTFSHLFFPGFGSDRCFLFASQDATTHEACHPYKMLYMLYFYGLPKRSDDAFSPRAFTCQGRKVGARERVANIVYMTRSWEAD